MRRGPGATVKHPEHTPIASSGLVRVTSYAPTAVVRGTVTLAVSVVVFTYVTLVTLTPVPGPSSAIVLSPASNPLPVIVTWIPAAPVCNVDGLKLVTSGGGSPTSTVATAEPMCPASFSRPTRIVSSPSGRADAGTTTGSWSGLAAGGYPVR